MFSFKYLHIYQMEKQADGQMYVQVVNYKKDPVIMW